ncbi:MAG: hypothetical protein ACLQDV_08895 [Candidatus Binataceae bacterium]
MELVSAIVLFAVAVGENWGEFVIGAATIGAITGFAVSFVERLRGKSVSWLVYGAILIGGGLLSASFKTWNDMRTLYVASAKENEALKRTTITAPVGIPKVPELIVKSSQQFIQLKLKIENYSTSDTVENIGSSLGLSFGNGKDQQTVEVSMSPSMRLNPLQTHSLELTGKFHGKKLSQQEKDWLKLFGAFQKQEPLIAVLNLYFTVKNVQFSQREQWSYIYGDHSWKIDVEQQFQGFITLPVGYTGGFPTFMSAPWLPPPPPNCSIVPPAVPPPKTPT